MAPSDAETDRTLVHAVLEHGSEDAYRQLYRRHTPRLYRLAIRLLGSEEDAEDVVQETWFRAASHLAGFTWRSQLSTWLCGITVNAGRELLARRGRWSTDEVTDATTTISLPIADGVIERVDIERAIATLPVGSRAAFLLHDVEGFTHEEIAEQLQWTPGTSKTQVFRARRALRRLLRDHEDMIHETRTRQL